MRQLLTYIALFIFLIFDCCRSKSNSFFSSGQLPGEKTGHYKDIITMPLADSLVKRLGAEKKFDSLNAFARTFILQETNNGRYVQAVQAAESAYLKSETGSVLQKDLALYLFEKKELIKKDTAAFKLFYNFFNYYYAFDFKPHTYDPHYIGMADYFISIQKENPGLGEDRLINFKAILGIIYNKAGDLKKAGLYYREILEYDKKHAPDYIGGSAFNLSIALIETGLYDSVIHFINSLLKTYSFSSYYLALLHKSLAEAYLLKGNIKMALQSIHTANALLSGIKNSEDKIKVTYEINEAGSQIQYALGNYQQSLIHSGNALQAGLLTYGEYRDRIIGKILLQIGAICNKLNYSDSAAWYFHQALYTVANVDSADTGSLPAARDVYAENTMMDALDSLAMIWDEKFMQTKNYAFCEKALQARQLAFIAERKLLEAFSYDEAMGGQLLQSKKRSRLALQNCYILWQNDKDKKWIQQSVFIAENSKAIILLHSIQRNKIGNQIRETDSTVKDLSRIRYQLIILERKINQAADAKSGDSMRNELEELNKQYLETEIRIRQKYPAYKREGVDTSLITIESLHKKIIKDQSCMLQYFVSDTGIFITWLDDQMNGGIEFLPASAYKVIDSFSSQCRLKRGLYDTGRTAFFSLSESCAQKIIPVQVKQHINKGLYRNLVVIPDGLICMVPFEALAFSPGEFLLQKCTIYTGHSFSTLITMDAVSGKPGSFAVFTPFSKEGHHQKARLPFTKDEAEKIKEADKTVHIVDDNNATLLAFRNSLQRDGIIHIATHATADPENEPRIFFSDSILYMPELYAANTRADLVVLSGCETGLGELNPNEGPMSLSRAFYYAGAKNVINSLWQIDDAATANLIGDFYKNYRPGQTGMALRKAKLNFLNMYTGSSASPYYWAGLIHTGLDKYDSSSKKPGIYFLATMLIAIVILLTAGLLYFRMRKKRKFL